MKPLVKYRGGKSKEIPHLINHIPHFSGRYIEPFFGGGALFFHLEPKKEMRKKHKMEFPYLVKGKKHKMEFPYLVKDGF